MRIARAQVLLSARHTAEQRYTRTERLVAGFATRTAAWGVEQQADGRVAARPLAAPTAPQTRHLDQYLHKSMQDGKLLETHQPSAEKTAVPAPTPVSAGTPASPVEPSPQEKAKIQLITAAIEGLSGKKIQLLDPEELAIEPPAPVDTQIQPPTIQVPSAIPADPDRPPAPTETAFGLYYRKTETYTESESMTFNAQGRLLTADGVEIAVDVEVGMSRQFYSEHTLDIKMEGVLKDPLVVNFDAPAAALTQTRYRFDIDSDGQQDQLHFVRPGSGFLALDRDANGRIDHGGELFGATSGNGFKELSVFDADGNRFIDRGDPVYDRLRIWSKALDGTDHLMGLGQRGIGAIYLGHTATPFALKNEQNQLIGQVRSSSFFLREDGSSGSVQQIDLVV